MRDLSGASARRALFANRLLEAPPANTITLRTKYQHRNGKGTNIQAIAVRATSLNSGLNLTPSVNIPVYAFIHPLVQ